MRIVHSSDIHIGMENYGRVDPATGISSRLTDFLATFDEVVDYAVQHRADLFLFTGDAFKTRDPNPTQQREFARRITRLRQAGIAVYLLVGNHDLPNATGKATPLDIYQILELEGVYVGTRIRRQVIQTRSGPVQIVSLPWLLRSAMLSRDDYKNKSLEEIHTLMLEKVQALLDDVVREIDPAMPAVFACHGTIMGASLGSERNIMLGQDLILNRGMITNEQFDYVALGHIHRHQVVSMHPLAIYAGSLQRIDFGEEDEDKGFVVVDVVDASPDANDGRAFETRYDFVPVAARPFLTIRVDADVDDPTAAVVEAIDRAGIEDKVVRLQVRISERREGLLRDADVRRALKDAYFVAGIGKEIEREQRSRLGGRTTAELTPTEALDAYLTARKTPPDRAKVLMTYAERLMAQTAEGRQT